jgi:hypothetical protein
MRLLAADKLGLALMDNFLPMGSLDQGLDVLQIMRNIHVFVARFAYNMNMQVREGIIVVARGWGCDVGMSTQDGTGVVGCACVFDVDSCVCIQWADVYDALPPPFTTRR